MNNTKVVEQLQVLLASSYGLYLKTQNFHWNVTGENFVSLHELFMNQYTELAKAIDTIAEYILTYGAKAKGGFEAYQKLSVIKDADENLDATAMLKNLIEGQDAILIQLERLEQFADEVGDSVASDLAIERMAVHKKNRWMLEASL